MGLREDIQKALSVAMEADLLDVVTNFTLVKTPLTEYDSDEDTRDGTPVLHTSKGMFFSFGKQETFSGINIQSENEKLIVNGADINVEIEIDDKIILEDGTEYTVVLPQKIAGGSTDAIVHSVMVRKN